MSSDCVWDISEILARSVKVAACRGHELKVAFTVCIGVWVGFSVFMACLLSVNYGYNFFCSYMGDRYVLTYGLNFRTLADTSLHTCSTAYES